MDKVFKLTNKYIILATPLILFSLISNMYLALSVHGRVINLIIAIAIILLMTGAFFAGWLNMIKTCVIEPDREEPNSLMLEFSSGVGEYFVPTTVALLNYFFLIFAGLVVAYFLGKFAIGDIGITAQALSKAIETPQALKTFLMSLSNEQIMKINQWNLLLMLAMLIPNFLTMLYLPAIFFKNKNPFIALITSLKDLFSRKFFTTLGIGILIFLVYFIISLFMAVFAGNSVLHFIITLANFYFVTVVSVGIFYYYYHTFVNPPKGQNIDIEI